MQNNIKLDDLEYTKKKRKKISFHKRLVSSKDSLPIVF